MLTHPDIALCAAGWRYDELLSEAALERRIAQLRRPDKRNTAWPGSNLAAACVRAFAGLLRPLHALGTAVRMDPTA